MYDERFLIFILILVVGCFLYVLDFGVTPWLQPLLSRVVFSP